MLIRPQAIAARRFSSFARARSTLPIPTLMTCVCTIAVLLTVTTLALTSTYNERVTVTGLMIPAGGVARVLAPRGGTITEVFVDAGDNVRAGDPMLRIASTPRLDPRTSHASAIEDVRKRHAHELQEQNANVARETRTALSGGRAQVETLEAEIAIAVDQIAAQRSWLTIAAERLTRYGAATARGAVPRVELLRIESETINGELQLKNLERAHLALLRQQQQAKERKAELEAALAARVSAIRLAQLELEHRALDDERQQGEIVVAPADGRVMTLAARRAADTLPGRELAVLAPDGAPLRAELLIPIQALGLVRTGQTVALRYDAFPFHEYGTFEATIESVSGFALDRRDLDVEQNAPGAVFRAIAIPRLHRIEARGETVALSAGMTLRADISLQEMTVFRWLLEPLLRLGHGPFHR